MNGDPLFCHLSSARIADLIRAAEGSVCYAGPGIQLEPAKAMAEVAGRIGPELLTVSGLRRARNPDGLRGYPLFVLTFCLAAKEDYRARIAPEIAKFKHHGFGHEAVILAAHEIRKAKGDFKFLSMGPGGSVSLMNCAGDCASC